MHRALGRAPARAIGFGTGPNPRGKCAFARENSARASARVERLVRPLRSTRRANRSLVRAARARAPRAARGAIHGARRGSRGGDVASARAPNSSPRPLRSTRRANRPRVRAPGPLHALRVRLPARGVAMWVAWPCGWSRGGKTVRGGGVGRVGGLEVNKRALERASSACARSCGRVGRLEVNKRARRASLVHLRDILPLS